MTPDDISKQLSEYMSDVVKNYPRDNIYTIGREIVTYIINTKSINLDDYYSCFMRGMYHSFVLQYNACQKPEEEAKVIFYKTKKDILELIDYIGVHAVDRSSFISLNKNNMFRSFLMDYIKKACVNCDVRFNNIIKSFLAQGVIMAFKIFNTYNSLGNDYQKYWLNTITELGNKINNNELRFKPLTIKELLEKEV